MAVVLIVEDEEQVRVMAESVLLEAGHTVIAATGTEGATALLGAEQHIDVLFVDLKLGNDLEAGLKFATEAKAARPQVAVLYTTGAGVPNDGMKAMFVEPFIFLPKPYTFEQLTESVAYLLQKSTRRPAPEWPSAGDRET
jgi:DNA-binding NtrC family response regulator